MRIHVRISCFSRELSITAGALNKSVVTFSAKREGGLLCRFVGWITTMSPPMEED
jgi:hypothetical protein